MKNTLTSLVSLVQHFCHALLSVPLLTFPMGYQSKSILCYDLRGLFTSDLVKWNSSVCCLARFFWVLVLFAATADHLFPFYLSNLLYLQPTETQGLIYIRHLFHNKTATIQLHTVTVYPCRILLCHSHPLNIHLNEPPLSSSLFPSAWRLHVEHTLCSNPPLHMFVSTCLIHTHIFCFASMDFHSSSLQCADTFSYPSSRPPAHSHSQWCVQTSCLGKLLPELICLSALQTRKGSELPDVKPSPPWTHLTTVLLSECISCTTVTYFCHFLHHSSSLGCSEILTDLLVVPHITLVLEIQYQCTSPSSSTGESCLALFLSTVLFTYFYTLLLHFFSCLHHS